MSKGNCIAFFAMVFLWVSCDETPPRFLTSEYPGTKSAEMKEASQEEFVFDTHRTEKGKVVSDLNSKISKTDIDMRRETIAKKKDFKQIQRQGYSDVHFQGFPGAATDEVFEQGSAKALDVVIVVDNSGSMKEEQENLATKLKPLLSFLGPSDWQIGVVSTDADSCKMTLVRSSDADQEAKFERAIRVGNAGNTNEQGLLAARRAMDGQCIQGSWVREQSTLAVLFVSDEDNCSDGRGCAGQPHAKASYLTDYLASMRELGVNARVYGIFWHPSMDRSECSTADKVAKTYSQLVETTGGHWGSVCDADYSETLSRISGDIGVILAKKFTLREAPELSTLQVFIDGVELTSGFSVNGKVVSFKEAPKQGARVRFSYKYSGAPMTNRFAVTKAFDPKSLVVSVNGSPVPAGSYVWDGVKKEIVFKTTPPVKAKIEIDYKEDRDLPKVFALDDKPYRSLVKVTVNGRATTAYTLDAHNKIDFLEAPADGALITAAYDLAGAPITKYALAVAPEVESTLAVVDSNGVGVAFAYADGWLVVAEHEFLDGRKIIAAYENVNRDDLVIKLPQEPKEGKVVVSDGKTTICQDAHVDGNVITIENCPFDEDLTQVVVEYEYDDAVTAFEVKSAKSDNPDDAVWSVWVNDVETDQFERTGWKISLGESPLQPGSVKVVLNWSGE